MTNLHLIEDEEDTRPCQCDNCGWQGPANETLPACDIQERIEAGNIIPIGECPECQALCYRTYAELTQDDSKLLNVVKAARNFVADFQAYVDSDDYDLPDPSDLLAAIKASGAATE